MNRMSIPVLRVPRPTLIVAALLLAGTVSLRAEASLKVGLPAPPVAPARWFHGEPAKGFPTNQVYVVEFRSPTGTASRAAIASVTALARKYAPRVTFINVNVTEPGADSEKQAANLAAFVRDQGPRRNCAVAADPADGSMAKAWLQPAGVTNLPVAFVVGQDGVITWIGHPVKGLEEAVVSALTPNPFGQSPRVASPELALRQRVGALRRAGKPKEALAALDEATDGNPILTRSSLSLRMSLLFQLDAPAARQECRTLADGLYKSDPPVLSTLAGILLTRPEPSEKAFALTLAERACEQTVYAEPGMIYMLARAQAANGNPAKSVALLEALAKRIETSGGADSAQLRKVQGEISTYRKAAKLPASATDPSESEPDKAAPDPK